jgi:hypothetical protein
VWVFNAFSKGWSEVAPLPEPRGGNAAVILDGRIDVGRMPTARNYARSVVYHRKIYVVGGSIVADSAHSAAGSRIVETFAPR